MEEDEGILETVHENRKLEKFLKGDNEEPDLLDAKPPTPKRHNLFRSYSEVLADWGLFLAK